jgi:hypothetical protein
MQLAPYSFGLSATSQQYFSLRTNQSPAVSQQCCSIRINQHQPSATSQTIRLLVSTLRLPCIQHRPLLQKTPLPLNSTKSELKNHSLHQHKTPTDVETAKKVLYDQRL